MSDTIPPIAASESKSVFMAGLGLRIKDPEGERLYKLMKQEAAEAYARVVFARRASSPSTDPASSEKPRYAFTQMDKVVLKEAIASIYRNASDETRALYDRGKQTDGDEEDNWIIRWMLWHAFRYRDSRNKRVVGGTSTNLAEWQERSLDSSVPASSSTSTRVEQSMAPSLQSQSSSETDKKRPGRPLPYDPTRADS